MYIVPLFQLKLKQPSILPPSPVSYRDWKEAVKKRSTIDMNSCDLKDNQLFLNKVIRSDFHYLLLKMSH